MDHVEKSVFEKFYSIVQQHPELTGNFMEIAEFAVEMSDLRRFLDTVRPQRTNHDLIRIGGESDGGYLVPNDLEGIEVCFSPGVAHTATFESELAARGLQCFMADYSVDESPIENPLFHFEKKYLGAVNDAVYMTLDSWVERKAAGEGDLILQMDIEGGEYSVLHSVSESVLQRFRIIVIEFHDMYRLCDKPGFKLINGVFERLLKFFDVVHIHPNNNCIKVTYGGFLIPSLLEFTFIRKDRVLGRRPAITFPHELDRQNIPGADLPLPSCWYSN